MKKIASITTLITLITFMFVLSAHRLRRMVRLCTQNHYGAKS